MNPLVVKKTIDVIQQHQQGAADYAEIIEQLDIPDQIQAHAVSESAKTRRALIAAGTVLAVSGFAVVTPLIYAEYASNKIGDAADSAGELADKVGDALSELGPQQRAGLIVENSLTHITVPQGYDVLDATGVSSVELPSKTHLLGVGIPLTDSDTTVIQDLQMEVVLPGNAVTYEAQKNSSNLGEGAQEQISDFNIVANVLVERDGQSTFEVTTTTLDTDTDENDAYFADADHAERIDILSRQGKAVWQNNCTEVLPNYLDDGLSQQIKQHVATAEKFTRAVDPEAANVLKELLQKDITVVFRDEYGTEVSPSSIKLPTLPEISKKEIAKKIDVDEEDFVITPDTDCSVKPSAINDLQTIQPGPSGSKILG